MHWIRKQATLPTPPTIEEYKKRPPCPDRKEGGLRINNSYRGKSEPERPLVSIITIVRNSEKTIERTIQSVLQQTYDNIEYIIVDGGSTDKTLSIIRKYERQISYWISEPDKGISDAFNKGISDSTGELIGTINSDDWYCENVVESIVNNYIQRSNYIFHGKCQYWDKEGIRPYYIFSGRHDITHTMTINHPTMFVPRKMYEEINLFYLHLKVVMDYEWIRRAKLNDKKFVYIDEVISNMRLGGVSTYQWWSFYIEESQVRYYYGIHPVENYLILSKMITISLIRKAFEHVGLNGVVTKYRKHFSILRKDLV